MDPAASAYIGRVGDGWVPLRAAIAALGEDGLAKTTPAGWTVKELLAHLAFWDEAVEGVVTLLFRGQPLPEGFAFGSGYVPDADNWPNFQVHNDREAAWARQHPAAQVLQRSQIAHERLLGVLASLSADEIAEHAEYFDGVVDHYAEHQAELSGITP
jgi:hypothetical protein